MVTLLVRGSKPECHRFKTKEPSIIGHRFLRIIEASDSSINTKTNHLLARRLIEGT